MLAVRYDRRDPDVMFFGFENLDWRSRFYI